MSAPQGVVDAKPSRMSRIRRSLSPREWRAVAGMAAFILFLHVAGWVSSSGSSRPSITR